MLPNQYQRQNSFDTLVKQQQIIDAAAVAANKKANAIAEKNTTLSYLIQEEANTKAQKISAEIDYATKYKTWDDAKKAMAADGIVTPQEQTAANYLGGIAAAQKIEVDSLTAAYKQVSAKRAALEKEMVPTTVVTQKKTLNTLKSAGKTKGSTSNTNTNNGTPAPKIPNPLIYYYNAPMIKTSYLNTDGPQQQTIKQPTNDPGNVLKAQESWTDAYLGSKGIIQMDSDVVMNTAYYAKGNDTNYDENLYGFKFLYNPKEVNMTWAVAEGMNWEGVQAGLDPGTAPTAALNNSTISFSLLLNRIGDMGYLTSNGLKQNVNPYTTFNIVPGKTIDQEVSEIYNKGTMYDLEYLFKTISGVNSTFTSKFSDITADRGWLYGFAVELHLGNKMRYKVRISSLEVNHAIFDERMVPILSYVNITCARFPNISQPLVGGGA
jgi:hypothetical protein